MCTPGHVVQGPPLAILDVWFVILSGSEGSLARPEFGSARRSFGLRPQDDRPIAQGNGVVRPRVANVGAELGQQPGAGRYGGGLAPGGGPHAGQAGGTHSPPN